MLYFNVLGSLLQGIIHYTIINIYLFVYHIFKILVEYIILINDFCCCYFRYLSGRLGLVSHAASIGLNRFVGTFALPSLIFVNMAVLELSSVNLIFLGSLLVSKTLVFASVALITVLVTRPPDIARAALFAIFCTQSNDFAIGAPICKLV